jgi:hypothetical protein
LLAPSLGGVMKAVRILPIVLAVLFGARNDGCSTASAASSVTPTDWTIAFSHNVPPRMIEEQGGGAYYFHFPHSDGVHYIIQQAPAMRAGQIVTMWFAIVGEGKLVPTQGAPPARVRLFLQQRGDRMTAAEEFKRWWSVASVELVAGEFVLNAELDPARWFSVFGKNGAQVPEAFHAAIADLEHVGFTFGGMFAGHGVYAIGQARFVLKQFSIK